MTSHRITQSATELQPGESRSARSTRSAGGFVLLAGCALAALGLALEPARALQGNDDPQRPNARLPYVASGANADSNNRMIAVTGIDVTGQSILYLVDTELEQIAVYQAAGGGPSTQGIKFVGARNISLDLELDGFNDKTESGGRPLPFKELQRQFGQNAPQDD